VFFGVAVPFCPRPARDVAQWHLFSTICSAALLLEAIVAGWDQSLVLEKAGEKLWALVWTVLQDVKRIGERSIVV